MCHNLGHSDDQLDILIIELYRDSEREGYTIMV